MSLNESKLRTLTRPLPRGEGNEDAMRMVKSEIGRVKFLNLKPFLPSLFTLHSLPERHLP